MARTTPPPLHGNMLPAVKSFLARASAAVKSVLAKAGAALTTIGLSGIAAYWIAVDTTTGPHSVPLLDPTSTFSEYSAPFQIVTR